jgi:hypothetical protein
MQHVDAQLVRHHSKTFMRLLMPHKFQHQNFEIRPIWGAIVRPTVYFSKL